MRVTSETPDRMTVEERPVLLAAVLAVLMLALAAACLRLGLGGQWALFGLGLAGLAVIGGMILGFVRRTTAVFDRASGSVTIRSISLFRRAERRLPLSTVTGATVETRRNPQSGAAFRAVLTLADGTSLPLSPLHTTGRGAHVTAQAITRWIAGSPGKA